jgi:hypothetical protein
MMWMDECSSTVYKITPYHNLIAKPSDFTAWILHCKPCFFKTQTTCLIYDNIMLKALQKSVEPSLYAPLFKVSSSITFSAFKISLSLVYKESGMWHAWARKKMHTKFQ